MQTAGPKNDDLKGTSLEIFSGDKMPAFVPSSMRAVSFLVNHHGFLRYDFPCSAEQVTSRSLIFASITEWNLAAQQPFLGLAKLYIASVYGNNNGNITVCANLEWGTDIVARISFLICNP